MLSIIIPVYNVEKYLRCCLDSLIKQLQEDVEILLIDDCSTDNSVDICWEYVEKHKNIRLLRQLKNQGVSAARNRGIDEAKGEYITFVDSDDFIAENYVERVMFYIEQGFDLVSFGHYDYIHSGDEQYIKRESGMSCACEAKAPQKQDWETLFLTSFFASPCNKIFKRSKLVVYENNNSKNIRFDTRCVCFEDYLFNVEYCKNIENFLVVSDPLYYYRQNSSVQHSGKRKWGQRFAVSNIVAEKTNGLIKTKEELDLSFLRRYVYTAFITELQFAYYFQNEQFDEAVREVSKSKEFKQAIRSIKPAGKVITLLKMAQKLKLYSLQKKLLKRQIVT